MLLVVKPCNHVQHGHDVIGIAAHHAGISVHPPLLPQHKRRSTTQLPAFIGCQNCSCAQLQFTGNPRRMCVIPCAEVSRSISLYGMAFGIHKGGCACTPSIFFRLRMCMVLHVGMLQRQTAFKLVNTQGCSCIYRTDMPARWAAMPITSWPCCTWLQVFTTNSMAQLKDPRDGAISAEFVYTRTDDVITNWTWRLCSEVCVVE